MTDPLILLEQIQAQWRGQAADAKREASHSAAMHSMSTYTRCIAKAGAFDQCADALTAVIEQMKNQKADQATDKVTQ
jgi:hypothetical protein